MSRGPAAAGRRAGGAADPRYPRPVRPLALAIAVAAASQVAAAGGVVRVEHARPDRVRVPAGVFTMGVPTDDLEVLAAECQQTVLPPSVARIDPCDAWTASLGRRTHRAVWVDAFWIDVHEVTTAAYRACARAGGCDPAPLVVGDTRHLRDDLPVVNVTRAEALRYCAWRGGRLPTEAEWERAARGDDHRTWPWGQARRDGDFNHGKIREHVLGRLADVSVGVIRYWGDPDDSDGWLYAAPPGSLRWSRSPFGVHDLAGNVAEWVLDDFDVFGFLDLPAANPLRRGPPGSAPMTRGGSWRDPPFTARVDVPSFQSAVPYGGAFLRPLDDRTRSVSIGFRCVHGGAQPDDSAPPRAR